jgi:hypothetical protein
MLHPAVVAVRYPRRTADGGSAETLAMRPSSSAAAARRARTSKRSPRPALFSAVGRIAKSLDGDVEFSDAARRAVSLYAAELIARVSRETGRMVALSGKKTAQENHVLAAVGTTFAGELAKNAMGEIRRVAALRASRPKKKESRRVEGEGVPDEI